MAKISFPEFHRRHASTGNAKETMLVVMLGGRLAWCLDSRG